MTLSHFRLRNLLLAAALAIAAMAATFLYVSRSRADAKTTPSAAVTSVLVATRDIPVGTTTAQIVHGGWVRVESVPQSAAVPDPVAAPSKLAGLVATQTTYAGEQLTTHRFGKANQQGIRSGLTGAFRIVELPGDPHQLLAGTLRDGDHVDIVASIAWPEGGPVHYSRIILRNILVVSAPTASGGGGLTAGQQTTSAQLQLNDKEAQRLFWVEQNAKWELVLRPGEHAANTFAAPVSADSFLGAGHGH